MSLDDMERTIIEKVLSDVDRNVSRAARLLGVSRETLRYRVQKHGLDRETTAGDGNDSGNGI
jgi:DNA-binding protein Fis